MGKFVEALDKSIKTENWYSVLFISLTLPDICGKIEYPSVTGSKKRTTDWCNKYLSPLYTTSPPEYPLTRIWLTGADFYALRCALLHEGSGDITTQQAREVLHNFRFVQPARNSIVHRNRVDMTLQLQVSEFGKDVITAVNTWINDIKTDNSKMRKIRELLEIQIIDSGGTISL